jgi:hypothetical protein
MTIDTGFVAQLRIHISVEGEMTYAYFVGITLRNMYGKEKLLLPKK